MIQNVSTTAALVPAANVKSAAPVVPAAAQNNAAKPETTVSPKAATSVAAINALAYQERREIAAALYDRSFTLGEGVKALTRQQNIQTYAEKAQAKEGGVTQADLAKIANKLEKAETQIQKITVNKQGADLDSNAAIDGKELDTVQDDLAARIKQGIKDGTLTEKEAEVLTKCQQEIADQETKLRESDGKLTAGEQKVLLDQLRKTADEINRARTNDVGVNLTYLNYQKSVDERQAALEKQLQAGIKAGTLTEDEVKDIRAEFDKSYKLEEEMQGDGKIVWREAVQMSSALNEVEIKLYDLQRNDAGKKLKDSFVDVKYVDQREAQQLEGIARGLDNKSLTNNEAISLLKDQQDIQAHEDKLAEGGLTRGEYLRLQTEMNDFSLKHADLASNADRWNGILKPQAEVAAGKAPAAAAASAPAAAASAPAAAASAPAAAAPAPAAAAPAPAAAAPAPAAAAPAPAAKPAEPEQKSATPSVAEQVKAENKAETQPTVPQINRELASDSNKFAELMTDALREQVESNAKAEAERAAEAKQSAADLKANDKKVKAEAAPGLWVAADKGVDFAALTKSASESKVAAYVATAAQVEPKATPAIAKKVA